MSWDIFAMDFPVDAAAVADIPRDFQPKPLGSRQTLIEKILEVVPSADFRDPSWGRIEGPSFSIEINIGHAENVESFAFHVRGGDEAVGVIAAILSHLDVRALDAQTGEFFEWGESALESFRAWRQFRDSVVREPTKH